MANLYVVSTPIGNLEDLTPRAARVLREASAVFAEDTRRTAVLLRHAGIRSPLIAYHRHNEARRTEEALGRLAAGEDLALVSDAGTPLISDPGQRLVDAALGAGHRVVPVPGASAVLAALVASGLPSLPFTFLGFPPRRGGTRDRFLERVAASAETVVLFESPERTAALLEDLAEQCGGERRAAVARELTKLYEDVRRGTLRALAAYYSEDPPKGEVTVVIAPLEAPPEASEQVDEQAARELGRALLAEGASRSRAAREVARRLGVPRNRVYALLQDLPLPSGQGEP